MQGVLNDRLPLTVLCKYAYEVWVLCEMRVASARYESQDALRGVRVVTFFHLLVYICAYLKKKEIIKV